MTYIADISEVTYRFQNNSDAHVAMLMMRSARRPITIQHLIEISPRFRKTRPEFLDRAVDAGYVHREGAAFGLTALGVDALCVTAAYRARTKHHKRRCRNDDSVSEASDEVEDAG